jgi:uncharacterized protein (TIGR03083 family)
MGAHEGLNAEDAMRKPHGTKEFWLAGLRAEAAAFRTTTRGARSLDVPVPTCPDWTLSQLVHHVGDIYAWVCSHVARGETSRPPRMPMVEAPDGAARLDWWDERYAELIGLLDRLDPEMPAWNWAPQAKRAVFWHRRMAHETAVHRWDAQVSLGPADPVEAKLAADGITEVFDSWLPAGRRRGATDVRGVVALHATDIGQNWYARLRGEGIALLDTDTLLDDAHPHERATASGSASDLLLALYGRVPFDMLEVAGDPRLLSALRTG